MTIFSVAFTLLIVIFFDLVVLLVTMVIFTTIRRRGYPCAFLIDSVRGSTLALLLAIANLAVDLLVVILRVHCRLGSRVVVKTALEGHLRPGILVQVRTCRVVVLVSLVAKAGRVSHWVLVALG